MLAHGQRLCRGYFDEESGLYFVTERDAHTWVEVFPEYGWIEFEPTAGESPLTAQAKTQRTWMPRPATPSRRRSLTMPRRARHRHRFAA